MGRYLDLARELLPDSSPATPRSRPSPGVRPKRQMRPNSKASHWRDDARKVIAAFEDAGVREALEAHFVVAAARLESQGTPRREAEMCSFGAMLFEALRMGHDIRTSTKPPDPEGTDS